MIAWDAKLGIGGLPLPDPIDGPPDPTPAEAGLAWTAQMLANQLAEANRQLLAKDKLIAVLEAELRAVAQANAKPPTVREVAGAAVRRAIR